MVTSSSLRMGMERTCERNCESGIRWGECELVPAYVVLLTELLGEGSAHDGAALVGGSLEVSGAALAAGGGNHCENCQYFHSSSNSPLNGVNGKRDVLLSNFIVAVSRGVCVTTVGN